MSRITGGVGKTKLSNAIGAVVVREKKQPESPALSFQAADQLPRIWPATSDEQYRTEATLSLSFSALVGVTVLRVGVKSNFSNN